MKDTHRQRHVRLFKNGRNQAIRIPREFELRGELATIRKEGDCLIIEPERRQSLAALLKSWEPLNIDFPDIDDLPALDEVAI
jgi:antitoxin VapB